MEVSLADLELLVLSFVTLLTLKCMVALIFSRKYCEPLEVLVMDDFIRVLTYKLLIGCTHVLEEVK